MVVLSEKKARVYSITKRKITLKRLANQTIIDILCTEYIIKILHEIEGYSIMLQKLFTFLFRIKEMPIIP